MDDRTVRELATALATPAMPCAAPHHWYLSFKPWPHHTLKSQQLGLLAQRCHIKRAPLEGAPVHIGSHYRLSLAGRRGCRPGRRKGGGFRRRGLATLGLGVVRQGHQGVFGKRRGHHHRRVVLAEREIAPLHSDVLGPDAEEAADRNDDDRGFGVLVE